MSKNVKISIDYYSMLQYSKDIKNNTQRSGYRSQGVYMSNYEYFMKRSEKAFEKAQSIKDVDVKKIFLNASKGFKIKANKLILEEAAREIIPIRI